jgi:protein-disulfide isomerase
MSTVSRARRRFTIGMKIRGINQGNVVSLVTFALLGVQVLLLFLLTQRVTNLEAMIRGSIVGEQPPAPTEVARNPDERGQVLGPATAPVTVVEFSDFECPFCRQAETTVKRLVATYPDQIRLIYRHFPLQNIHPNALHAAEASECAAEQGRFWQMHDVLFANHAALAPEKVSEYAGRAGLDMQAFSTCLANGHAKSAVQQDMTDGERYGVQGTPTFFVNRRVVVGEQGLERTIRQALGQ